MDGAGRESAGRELVGDLRGGALGAAEDDGQAPVPRLEDPGEHLDLVHRVRAVDELLDRLDRVAVVLGRREARMWVGWIMYRRARATTAPGMVAENSIVWREASVGEQLLDVGQEAEVEHLVRLVEHDGLDVREVEVALLHQVDQATGRAHDDLDAALEGLDLGLVGAAAVHRENARRAVLGGDVEVLRDLDGELARRGDDEGLGLSLRREVVPTGLAGAEKMLKQRDAESEGLAGSGLGLPDDVVSVERDRQGHFLDGKGVDDAAPGRGPRRCPGGRRSRRTSASRPPALALGCGLGAPVRAQSSQGS